MSPTRLTTTIYFSTVFLTGAAVLIFEVAAVRLLSPYFGSSLYVLSSVLTVILASLSLGYYLGGRLADRMPHFVPLYFIIGFAGVSMLFLQHLAQYTLPTAAPLLSIMTGPLILALILFFIPAFLLGIDSPFVIKLLSANASRNQSGAIVGSTFFWSTVGSIVGSLSAGFLFIPNLGLTLTITLVSLVLIAWCSLALLTLKHTHRHHLDQPNYPFPIHIGILGLILVGVSFSYVILTFHPTDKNMTVLYEKDGFYSNIKVFERAYNGTTYRFLKRDTNHSSAILPGSNKIVFPYTQFATLYTGMVPEAKKYLVLGGGAYTIPRHVHDIDPGIQIDTVEIEPYLFDIAHTYFELPRDEKIQNHLVDARVFLNSTTTTYDIIFSDVMNSGHIIPPHLSTREFFASFKDRLAPDGLGIINYIGSLDTDELTLTGSMIKTIHSVFPNLKIIAIDGPTAPKVQNLLFFVRHDNMPIVFPNEIITNVFTSRSIPAAEMEIDITSFNLDNQMVFTDDKAPLEPLILKQFAKD